MFRKKFLFLAMALVMMLTVTPALVHADADGYEVAVMGFIDDTKEYNGKETFVIEFQIKMQNGMGVKNAQSLKLAYDNAVFEIIRWGGGAYTGILQTTPFISSATLGYANKFEEDGWNASTGIAISEDNQFGYLRIEPSLDDAPICYTEFTALQSVRLAFRDGKSIADVTQDSIRLMNAAELELLHQSNQIEISNGSVSFMYGSPVAEKNNLQEPIIHIVSVSCVEGEGVATTDPTCEEDGVMTYYCEVCGAELRAEPIAATGHTEGEGVATTDPTCEDDGVMTFYCEDCGDELRTEPIDALGHDWIVDEIVDPTCEDQGYTVYVCSRCDEDKIDDYTEATGHTEGEGVATTDATCEDDGVMTYYCEDCGEELRTEPIAATGHTEIIKTVDPTITEDGYYVLYCPVCDKELGERIVIPALGVSVSGLIRTYNPNNEITIELRQGDEVKYTTTIEPESGYGQITQTFEFTGVAPGVYDLIITKAAHTTFTVKNVTVIEEDLDLSEDLREDLQVMTLICGDLNGDGNVNVTDLNILWSDANYGKSVNAAGVNPLCDIIGNGIINVNDLNILWGDANYGKGEVIIDY